MLLSSRALKMVSVGQQTLYCESESEPDKVRTCPLRKEVLSAQETRECLHTHKKERIKQNINYASSLCWPTQANYPQLLEQTQPYLTNVGETHFVFHGATQLKCRKTGCVSKGRLWEQMHLGSLRSREERRVGTPERPLLQRACPASDISEASDRPTSALSFFSKREALCPPLRLDGDH